MGPGRLTLKEFAAFFKDHFADQYMVIYACKCNNLFINAHSNCCACCSVEGSSFFCMLCMCLQKCVYTNVLVFAG